MKYSTKRGLGYIGIGLLAFAGGFTSGAFKDALDEQSELNAYRDQEIVLGLDGRKSCQVKTTVHDLVQLATDEHSNGLVTNFLAFPLMCQRWHQENPGPFTCDKPENCG